MRFMLIVLEDEGYRTGRGHSAATLTALGGFTDQLMRAGVLLADELLAPSSSAKRIRFSGDERVVTAGPFDGPSESIAGFWMVQTAGEDEALEWARRIPLTGGTVELRCVAGDEAR